MKKRGYLENAALLTVTGLALRAAGGSREEAAQALGISRTTLWRKLKEYHLS